MIFELFNSILVTAFKVGVELLVLSLVIHELYPQAYSTITELDLPVIY